MQRIGELAAFGTAVGWTVSSLFFEQGIKRIGVLGVNFYKVVISFVLLTITAAVMRGMPLPLDAPASAWIFLSLSGIVGFSISDLFLFNAYRTVGPRITMLFMALSPPMTAGIAYIFLGEQIGQRGLVGMGLVIAGICLTVFGKQEKFSFSAMKKEDRIGYIFAFCSSVGQSIGMNLTKVGLGGYHPVSGTQIRSFAGLVGFAVASFIFDRCASLKTGIKDFQGMKNTALGAVAGPYFAVSLSLFALQKISAGIVSTFVGLTPVLIILPEVLYLKRKIKPVEIAGAVLAVAGTTVFFL
jgi:drug/metabolite transporter (DMT)-like permease